MVSMAFEDQCKLLLAAISTAVETVIRTLPYLIREITWLLLALVYIAGGKALVLCRLTSLGLCVLGFAGSIELIVIVFYYSAAYFVLAYFRVGSSPSKSCFFMPCSPQSIREEDQLWALFAGLFSFMVCEIIGPGYKSAKDVRKKRRVFVQEVEARLRESRRAETSGATELTGVVRRTTGP
jgi:hypothetical protein